MRRKIVGVLALQGAFAKHEEVLRRLGAGTREVRSIVELSECDALILPGGESTTILRLLEREKLLEPLLEFAKTKPMFGTCAGLILMSKNIVKDSMIPMGVLDVDVERNAYGRQIDSFKSEISLLIKPAKPQPFPAFFIRAPSICRVGKDVKVLGSHEGEPILVRDELHLGATFHPELTTDPSIHSYFLDMVKEKAS